MTDEEVLKLCFDKRGYINSRIIQEINKNNSKFIILKKYLDNRFIDSKLSTYRELIIRIKYNIEKIPKCPVCGKNLHFIGRKNKIYTDSCSIKCIMNNINVKEKIKQTNLKRYGCEHNWQIPEEQIKSHSKEAIFKCYLTKQKKGTLGGPNSQMEDDSYKIIKEKYNDVKRQYFDKDRYPFACDFYIPSLDLFIECQYYPSHGNHPYNSNDKNDIQYAKQLSKTKFGSYTWTVRDVLKRNTAKQNNLNYLEFFTILELENWLKTYEAESKHYGENNI